MSKELRSSERSGEGCNPSYHCVPEDRLRGRRIDKMPRCGADLIPTIYILPHPPIPAVLISVRTYGDWLRGIACGSAALWGKILLSLSAPELPTIVKRVAQGPLARDSEKSSKFGTVFPI